MAQSRKRTLTEQELGLFDEVRRRFEVRCLWNFAPTPRVEGNRAVTARHESPGDMTTWRFEPQTPVRMPSNGFQRRVARVPGALRWYLDDESGRRVV